MKFTKTIITFSLLFFLTGIHAQSRLIKKADRFYKSAQYALAIPLYEQALQEDFNRRIIRKLANCYRKNNMMEKAVQFYAEIVEDEKTAPVTWAHYGECLMSTGQYDEAKKWLSKYAAVHPKDENVKMLITSCDVAKHIKPLFQDVSYQPFAHNSGADDNAAIFWKNGILFTSDRDPDFKLLKEKSTWTGRYYLNLYYSKYVDGNYKTPVSFSSKLSFGNKNTSNASITADGRTIYFTRNSLIKNKKNTYVLQLLTAESNGRGGWKNVRTLPFCSNEYDYLHPAISPDGKYLFFVSGKKGYGGTDIFYVKKTKKGWGKVHNLGELVNTPANEGFPFVSSDGKLYFCSKGHPGYGGYDIFVTERDKDGVWQKPVNVGAPINSPQDDISFSLAKSTNRGLFSSSRDGRGDDIFIFSFGGNEISVDTAQIETGH